MTRKITETKVIREYNSDSFARRINELIEQDWNMKGWRYEIRMVY